jgi:streptogramin lyase
MIRKRSFMFVALIATTALAAAFFAPRLVKGAESGAILTGMAKSSSGEKMAGVTVSARVEGSSITTTVFTDDQGNYYFPPLHPGKYQVWAQADTFQTARGSVDLAATPQHQDFTLLPLKDFARQLTGDQLIDSFPDKTADDKRLKMVFRNTCTSCHQPNYILQNKFDTDGWISMMNLMRQIGVTGLYGGEDSAEAGIIEYHKKELAAYLARVSGPNSASEMKYKIRPRPTGDAARVVFTEYQVPLDPEAGYTTKYVTNDGSDWSLGTPSSLNGGHGVHDAQADLMGNIWFTYNVESTDITVGRIDAQTGEVKFFKVPGGRPGMAAASHGINRAPNGILWFNVNPGGRGSLGRIDPVAQKIDVFSPPKEMSGVTGGATTIDIDGKGKVWVTAGTGALRFDPETSTFMAEYKSLSYTTADGTGNTYGLAADREGNAWWAEMSIDTVGKSDIETGKSQEVKLPPVPGRTEMAKPEEAEMYHMAGGEFNFAPIWSEGPRRMGADHNGDFVYVCDYWGGNIAKIDIHTLKTTIIPLPKPDVQQPYHATVDSNHNVWINLMNSDEVARFNPTTGQWTEFPFPTLGGETRYVSVLEKDGTTQVILPYSRARKVARMVLRSKEDIQALKNQVDGGKEQASAK